MSHIIGTNDLLSHLPRETLGQVIQYFSQETFRDLSFVSRRWLTFSLENAKQQAITVTQDLTQSLKTEFAPSLETLIVDRYNQQQEGSPLEKMGNVLHILNLHLSFDVIEKTAVHHQLTPEKMGRIMEQSHQGQTEELSQILRTLYDFAKEENSFSEYVHFFERYQREEVKILLSQFEAKEPHYVEKIQKAQYFGALEQIAFSISLAVLPLIHKVSTEKRAAIKTSLQRNPIADIFLYSLASTEEKIALVKGWIEGRLIEKAQVFVQAHQAFYPQEYQILSNYMRDFLANCQALNDAISGNFIQAKKQLQLIRDPELYAKTCHQVVWHAAEQNHIEAILSFLRCMKADDQKSKDDTCLQLTSFLCKRDLTDAAKKVAFFIHHPAKRENAYSQVIQMCIEENRLSEAYRLSLEIYFNDSLREHCLSKLFEKGMQLEKFGQLEQMFDALLNDENSSQKYLLFLGKKLITYFQNRQQESRAETCKHKIETLSLF